MTKNTKRCAKTLSPKQTKQTNFIQLTIEKLTFSSLNYYFNQIILWADLMSMKLFSSKSDLARCFQFSFGQTLCYPHKPINIGIQSSK